MKNKLQKAYQGCMECGGSKLKSGGWLSTAVKHPGRCTPGSPNYDCPKGSPQWNLAQRFKHGDLHKGAEGMKVGPKPTMGPMPYTPMGKAPAPKPKYNLVPRENGEKSNFIDSGFYENDFKRMLKNDPKALEEYARLSKYGPEYSPEFAKVVGPKKAYEGYRVNQNTLNAYEDALSRKRKMMMGGSIPGVNGSVIGPSVPMSKKGQSFPRKNAGTSTLAKFKKK